jgi:type II secretory pathway predicted ATPase ExeA
LKEALQFRQDREAEILKRANRKRKVVEWFSIEIKVVKGLVVLLVCSFFSGKVLVSRQATQQCVHADGWILTAKMAMFVTLGFVRFVGESRPSSRR